MKTTLNISLALELLINIITSIECYQGFREPVASLGLVSLGAVTDGVTLFLSQKTDDLFTLH